MKLITKILGTGILMAALGLTGTIIGDSKKEYEIPGFALAVLGGLTCLYGSGYVRRKEEKKLVRSLQETIDELNKYNQILKNSQPFLFLP